MAGLYTYALHLQWRGQDRKREVDLTPDVIEAIVSAVQVIALAVIAAWSHQTKSAVSDNGDKLDKLNGGK